MEVLRKVLVAEKYLYSECCDGDFRVLLVDKYRCVLDEYERDQRIFNLASS